MVETNEKSTSGIVESVELGEKKDGGKYIRMAVSGQRYSFWDNKWYEEHPELFQMNAKVNVIYAEKEYTDKYGKQRMGRNATSITKATDDQIKTAKEVHDQQDVDGKEVSMKEMKIDMTNAWIEAFQIAKGMKVESDGIELNRDDIRSTAMSLFIEQNKRRKF